MMHYTSFALVNPRRVPLLMLVALLAGNLAGAADSDPPGRVARVNFLEGDGEMQAAGVDAWTDDLLNRPLTGGDRIWIAEGSRAEMHVGSTALRLGSRTAVQILAIDDHRVRLALTAGSMSVRIRALDVDERFDIETPAGAVSLVQPGGYRLDVDDSNQRAFLAVWSGRAEVSGRSGTTRVRDDEAAELNAGDDPAVELTAAGNTDGLDLWAEDRDHREDQSRAADYVSREVVGYQDLDAYGDWVVEPVYGTVWVPVVAAGWAPYRYGYWSWIGPWGWTWMASEPWGFAPCHYGRWVHARHGWAWLPGERAGPRPVYAPALVAWRGDRYLRHDSGASHTPRVGWVPLGYNEMYDPQFRASREYIRATNLSNTRLRHGAVERYIDDRQRSGAQVVERHYVNETVPGAVTAAPRASFASGRATGFAHTPIQSRDTLAPSFGARAPVRTVPADRPVTRFAASALGLTGGEAAMHAGTRMHVGPPAQSHPPAQSRPPLQSGSPVQSGAPVQERLDRPLLRSVPLLSTVVAQSSQTHNVAPPAYRESPRVSPAPAQRQAAASAPASASAAPPAPVYTVTPSVQSHHATGRPLP